VGAPLPPPLRRASSADAAPFHALHTFFQQRPWAAEVQAHELLAVITEFDPCAEPDLGLLQEEPVWVIQAQGAAIQPGQERALGRVHDDAGQARAHGVEQVVTVGLQVLQCLQPFAHSA
jgi:hypothetical protein